MEKRRGRRRERDKACACWICSTSLFLYYASHPLLCLSPVIQSLMIKHRVMLPLYRLFYLQYLLCFFALSQKMIYTTALWSFNGSKVLLYFNLFFKMLHPNENSRDYNKLFQWSVMGLVVQKLLMYEGSLWLFTCRKICLALVKKQLRLCQIRQERNMPEPVTSGHQHLGSNLCSEASWCRWK